MTVDSVSAARLEVAREYVGELLPDNLVPITEESIRRISREDWVARETLDPVHTCSMVEQKRKSLLEHFPSSPSSPSTKYTDDRFENLRKRRAIVLQRLGAAWAGGSLLVTEDVIKHAADHDWVLREVERREKAALEKVRDEVAREAEYAEFTSDVVSLPADGYGGWYESAEARCRYPGRGPIANEVARVIRFARQNHADPRAQETACDAVANAASPPLRHVEDKAHAALVTLLTSEGLDIVLRAAHNFKTASRLQLKVCQALWHLTSTIQGARAAQMSGAEEVLVSAMMRYPMEKTLLRPACAALANIAKHLSDDTPPNAFHIEAVGVIMSAMANFPVDVELHAHACIFLWQLATRDHSALVKQVGLKGMLEHSAQALGIREAKWLLECLQWQTPAEALTSRGGNRRRWGQWATGRTVAA